VKHVNKHFKVEKAQMNPKSCENCLNFISSQKVTNENHHFSCNYLETIIISKNPQYSCTKADVQNEAVTLENEQSTLTYM
jgi:hypothetical protein